MNETQHVNIYTDGACIGNPGPGGYAAILIYGDHRREISGGFKRTTNNRMEIMGAIVGLESLKHKCKVTLYSDSKYLVDSASKGWVIRWKSNSWMRNKKNRALNVDLWERLLILCDSHDVTFEWVKGHSINSENIRCDQLATIAAQDTNLTIDEGYESITDYRPQLSYF